MPVPSSGAGRAVAPGVRLLSTSLAMLALTVGAACTSPEEAETEPMPGSSGGKADDAFAEGPMFLTGAFDGSQGFKMWADTLDYTRQFKCEQGKALHWTYF